jgi:hypothetical protein
MAEPLLYLASCPHCNSVVAAATPWAVHRSAKTVTEWLKDGLNIERGESAMCLEHHKPGCPFAASSDAAGQGQ